MCAFGAVWNGRSVGEMYLRAEDGPVTARVLSDSSSMGVMGGGGVSGGDGDVTGVDARGEGVMGLVTDKVLLGLRERCERCERDGDPTPAVAGVTSPPAASKMLPRSLP